MLEEAGDEAQAVELYRESLTHVARSPKVLNDLAWILACSSDPEVQNPAEAIRLAEKACEQTGHKIPETLATLTSAYIAANRIEDALRTAQKALDLARAQKKEALAQQLQKLMENISE
jgi:tetratricopeptide (TPR) repeat protein